MTLLFIKCTVQWENRYEPKTRTGHVGESSSISFFMTFCKLEAMVIYVVKQVCGNDTLAYVFTYYHKHFGWVHEKGLGGTVNF